MVKEKQLILIDSEYKLENIICPKHYLPLWLGKKSLRSKFWKPTQWNDKTQPPHKCKDILEYQASVKCTRIDSMLKQKYAYGICDDDEGNVRFMKLMIGVGYELENGTKFVVSDVKMSKESQIVQYFMVLEFSLHSF